MRRSDYKAAFPPNERLVGINIVGVHRPNDDEVILMIYLPDIFAAIRTFYYSLVSF